MPSQTTDRNMLMGILALQMDFITRDSLISAMRTWVTQKTRPLEQILLDQQALSAECCELLSALVEKHLELHDNDAQRCLGSLSSIGTLREDLVELNDEKIQNTLTAIRTGEGRRTTDDDSLDRSSGESTSKVTRFRILRSHAEGGLGTVSVAFDSELHREVALKEIRSSHADDQDSRNRFLLEAEVTGGLEHPGIVPVYGLGQYADGRPYYAMRFIRGDNLRKWITQFHKARSALEDTRAINLMFRKLLGRFVDVCNAIEYAHSRGVLHRDLKPGNIMLGKYGETLVVDWGLAKPVDQPETRSASDEAALQPHSGGSSAPTEMGRAIGTPAYMPPEQAAGQYDQLGPESDVYSLGATLYCVMTGRPPFEPSSDILSLVQSGQFARPRDVVAGVPKSLEAICLKAMAMEPKERYSSPVELAAEIEHWLADEPVKARPESTFQRLARWSRRHRAWTQAIGGAMVLVTVISLVATLLVDRQYRIAVQQRRVAVALSHKNEQLAKDESAARAEAERRFGQVRELANTFVFQVNDAIERLPGATPARQLVVKTATDYLDNLSQDAADDLSLRSELATAYMKIGDIQGNDNNPNLGEPEAAIISYKKALAHWKTIRKEKPENLLDIDNKIGSCHDRLGFVYAQQNKLADAVRELSEALALAEKHIQVQADDLRSQLNYWVAVNRIADLYKRMGRFSESADKHVQALEFISRLNRSLPDDIQVERFLGISCGIVGEDQERRKEYDQAMDNYRKKLAIAEKQTAADENDARAIRDIAMACGDICVLLAKMGRSDEAIEHAHRAVEIFQQLATADPENIQAQHDLGLGYQNLGQAHQRNSQFEEALVPYRKAREAFQGVAQKNPSNLFMERAVAIVCNQIAEVLEELQRWDEAKKCYQESLAIHKRHVEADPQNHASQRSLSIAHQNVGIVSEAQGQWTDALHQYERSLAIRERLLDSQPDDSPTRSDAAYMLERIAWLLATCPEPEARDGKRAREAGERANELSDGEDASVLEALAAACAETGDFEAAVKHQESAIVLTTSDSLKTKRQQRLSKYKAHQPHRQTAD